MIDRKPTDIWIVSTEPASTNYGSDISAQGALTFKESVSIETLKELVQEFTIGISEVLSVVSLAGSEFQVDEIEINAVMAADGKLGLLGSSVGAKTEGGIKFIFKRRPTS